MQIVDDSGRLLLSLIGCFKEFVAQHFGTCDNLLAVLRVISISSSLIPLAATFGKLSFCCGAPKASLFLIVS
jgi:hypothetical protein